MRKIALILLLAASVFVATAQGGGRSVRAKLSADTIMIGDQITMEIFIEKDIATEIQLPMFENGIVKGLEVVGQPTVDTIKADNRQIVQRLNYTITSFDAGTYGITGIPILFTDKDKTDTVRSEEMLLLYVKTFEIDTTTQQIADIKQPLDTPLQWIEIKELVYYSIAGAVVLAIIIYFMIKWLKGRRRKVKLRPQEPSHILAIRSLEGLHSKKLPESGRFKEYYSELTDILRTYLDDRYGIWAMEMTTPQIIDSLKEVNDQKMIAKLGELFSLADLVKFAKWTPTTEECQENFQVAYYYIEQTKEITINNLNPEQDA